MSLERLLASLERSAETEAERLVAEARAEAARLTEEASERRRRRREITLADRSTAWHAESARPLADARERARADVLAARNRLIERVLSAARARFPVAIRREAYTAALPRRLEEALSYVGGRTTVVRCPPTLAGAFHVLLGEQPGLVLDVDERVAPGFVLVADDGALSVDATLEGRLVAAGPALALEITALAFPSES